MIKKSVLKQTTYEFCRYTFYLEYLKWHSQYISALTSDIGELGKYEDGVPIMAVVEAERKKRSQITTEMDDITRTFTFAFKAYSEYENNLITHILLDLLREDFLVLREELHKNLNPINQVVYKISNAMKK